MKLPAGQLVSITWKIAALCGCLPGGLNAQATLPATSPTSVTPSQLPSANPAVTPGTATIQWDGYLLRITASGEPLSQVLSEVAARAGIRMTGIAPSDRIYGNYGPAPLVDVLSDLVSGLPVNMLFVGHAGSAPSRLIFTARNGSASPPSASENVAVQPSQPNVPAGNPGFPSSGRSLADSPAQANPVAANPGFGGSSTDSGAASSAGGSGNPSSPNGVKTPQEIFEQLQRLRANAGAQR